MVDELRFDGDVVVITGAAGGLGRSQALDLARRGARVVANDLGGSPNGGGADPGLVQAVVEEIRAAGGEAVACTDSVATPEGGERIVEAALDTWGRLDAIVTNAAIYRDQYFEDLTIDDWDQVMNVNARGTFCTLQPAYRAMKEHGGGRIVTLTSHSGLCGGWGQSNYSASKMAVIGLTRSIAWEGERFGIQANVVTPAATDSRMVAAFAHDDAHFVDRSPRVAISLDNPFTALLQAERVTPMVVALAHRSCPVTGEVYGAFGGSFSRFWTSGNEGAVPGLHPTAEDVVEHWDEIRSAGEPGVEVDEEVLVWITRRLGPKLAGLAEQLPAG